MLNSFFKRTKVLFVSTTVLLISSFTCHAAYEQTTDSLLAEQFMGVAYSGFREGQHPDRGNGAVNPSDSDILEDLQILIDNDFNLIRLYDSGENSETVLKLIAKHDLNIKVLLGMWLEAEISNHEGCAWLNEPIPQSKLLANTQKNIEEIARGIALSRKYKNTIVAVNVGNEALVDWNDHMVPVASVINYVKDVKHAIAQPVTVADNYEWWIAEGAELAKELDFIGVHTYPAWEEKTIEEALSYTIDNIERVHQALPNSKIAILEAGWASEAIEFGVRASEKNQARHFNELKDWSKKTNTTILFFEAFDEPWKGNPDNVKGAEKHWGLFNVDRTPKQVMKK